MIIIVIVIVIAIIMIVIVIVKCSVTDDTFATEPGCETWIWNLDTEDTRRGCKQSCWGLLLRSFSREPGDRGARWVERTVSIEVI